MKNCTVLVEYLGGEEHLIECFSWESVDRVLLFKSTKDGKIKLGINIDKIVLFHDITDNQEESDQIKNRIITKSKVI